MLAKSATRVKTERPPWRHLGRLRAPVVCFVLASVGSWVVDVAVAAAEREQSNPHADRGRMMRPQHQSPPFLPPQREERASGFPDDLKASASRGRQLDADSGLKSNEAADAMFRCVFLTEWHLFRIPEPVSHAHWSTFYFV